VRRHVVGVSMGDEGELAPFPGIQPQVRFGQPGAAAKFNLDAGGIHAGKGTFGSGAWQWTGSSKLPSFEIPVTGREGWRPPLQTDDMKTNCKTLAIVGLALGITSSMPLAQAEPGAPGSGAFFEKADQNGDGKITSDEAGEKWDRLSKADKDGDGGVSRQEMASVMGAMGAGAMFEKADANADGKISEAEAGERWERLGKADKDGDGFVSREEFAVAVRFMAGAGAGAGAGGAGGRPDPREFLAKVDKDGNGAFTEDEVPAELWEKISKADANSDGKITPEEIQKARAAAGGEAPGAGGAGQAPKRPPLES